MDVPEPVEDDRVVYEGRIIEVVRQEHRVGDEVVDFETARRAPGVRLIILDEAGGKAAASRSTRPGGSVRADELLLTHEYRAELGEKDWRLPGGKVFDRLEDYQSALDAGEDILAHAREAVAEECREETGLVPTGVEHYQTAHCGATVDWDLYYFVIDDWEEHGDGQDLEAGEVIDTAWTPVDRVREMCLAGEMQEYRSVGVLLRFLGEHAARK